MTMVSSAVDSAQCRNPAEKKRKAVVRKESAETYDIYVDDNKNFEVIGFVLRAVKRASTFYDLAAGRHAAHGQSVQELF